MKRRTIENPLIKDKVTFLETSAETDGKHTYVEVELSPGGGNDLHYHKAFSETFEVLEGELEVEADGEKIILKKGENFTVVENIMHRFFNPSDSNPVTFNVLLQPGHSGFENTLMVAYGLCRDGRTNKKGIPKSFYHLSLLMVWSDSNLPGIYQLIMPIMRWFAQKARKKGIEGLLLEEYCY
ncbi:cupin domain-containing protein [Solitalea sp. MAHUQ-68]|uniref:Cupin domain-containing protein n=1 Tax=Solitalea agri TaxID=2953739 RepID=A0A9X2JEJ1_9SPHI|nr:cupin domain-containing protein [Solitalea agri]MCO4294774.1 cupin domain-containing protein [Solitalea agri]